MISLHKNTKEQYGLEALKQQHLWEKSVLRASDYRNHRIFTLKCISHNLTPVSIKLKPTKSKFKISTSVRKIIERAEKQLLQDRVQGINKVIEVSNNNGNNNKARLASLVTSADLDKYGNFSDKVREERFNKVKERQVSKFHILYNKNTQGQSNNRVRIDNRQGVNAYRSGLRHQDRDNNQQSEATLDNSKWVINLSKTRLTKAQESVLAKGPNYVITPIHIPNVDYITAIELVCPKLKEEDSMELRADVNSLLRKAKVPKANLTEQVRIGLSQLKEDKERVILTVDKGVVMVIMDREDYNNKAQDLLNSPAYRSLSRDPTNKIKAQLITKLRKIKKDRNLDEGMYRAMYSTRCVPPKFYGLPKIH